MVSVLHFMVQRGVMPEIVIEQMNGLSSLPRVEAISMFCSKQDHEKLRWAQSEIYEGLKFWPHRYVIEEMEIASSPDRQKWMKSFSLGDVWETCLLFICNNQFCYVLTIICFTLTRNVSQSFLLQNVTSPEYLDSLTVSEARRIVFHNQFLHLGPCLL